MADLHERNPKGRFTDLSNLYAKCRPDYPREAIDAIVTRCGLDESSLVIDVGCGTGISSRIVAARGYRVIGIEPNADMRAKAETEPMAKLEYREGSAEATGLADEIASVVLSAQAFHWFECEVALVEFHRILRPGGYVALLWNERDERDPFTHAYGEVIRSAPDAKYFESARASAGEPLLTSPLFRNGQRLEFAYHQDLDERGVLGRAFSASYAPREASEVERFTSDLRAVFAQFKTEANSVSLRYITTLFFTQK